MNGTDMNGNGTAERSAKRPDLVLCPSPQAAAREAAEQIAAAVRSRPDIVLGLATGGTPVGIYRLLAQMHREGGLDFSRVRTFNLDEYIGLGPEHSQSFRHFMQEHLFDHINIPPEQTHIPSGSTTDVESHAREYEAQIRDAGGIDLQLLGIGANGHIAFNEPGSPADSRTRIVELTPETIDDNSRFFASIEDVPRTAVTMGIGTILEARRILLMATGTAKADAVARSVQGPPSADCPASLLQRHPHATFILDHAAAEKLA